MPFRIKAQLWRCHSLWAKHDGLVCWTDRKVPSCCNTGKWKQFAERNVWTDWNCVFGIIFRRWTLQQALNSRTLFSSVAGLGNEMKLKVRRPTFSLIRIWCQRAFFFLLQFRYVPPLSKCCYTLTIWLGALGRSKSHSWEPQSPIVVLSVAGKLITDQFAKVCDFSFSLLQPPIQIFF